MGLSSVVSDVGVVTGDKVRQIFDDAKQNKYAIPAVNVTSSSIANSVLEAAKAVKAPIILQVSSGGSAYFAGKGIGLSSNQASVAGSTAAGHFIRAIAGAYKVPVILHSDHCAHSLLEWFDGMLAADEKYAAEYKGEPLFSSHMLDLSEEPDEYNIELCKYYFRRMAKLGIWLEMEIGITGGEEDGVNNESTSQDRLYTKPETVWAVHEALSTAWKKREAPAGATADPADQAHFFSDLAVKDGEWAELEKVKGNFRNFSIAAAFGNVHGVYKPGAVQLRPELLGEFQEFAVKQLADPKFSALAEVKTVDPKQPLYLVFHGGSGSTKDEIKNAVTNGVVKMNVDTDTQWAYLTGIRDFIQNKSGYLQSQVGNPDGADKPNKKFYDPRVWVREGEKTLVERVKIACTDLGNVDRL